MQASKLPYNILILLALAAMLTGCNGGTAPTPQPQLPVENPQVPVDLGLEPQLPDDPREVAIGFEEGVPITAGSIGMALVAHDLTADGLPDLVIPFLGGDVKVISNTSEPEEISFDTAQTPIGTDANINDLALGDLNGDGLADLFTTESGKLSVFLQDEYGDFSLFQEFPHSNEAFCMAVCEVNSDDDVPDVLIGNNRYCEADALFFRPETFETWPEQRFTTPQSNYIGPGEYWGQLYNMELVDFEGNGVMDFMLTDKHHNQIHVYAHIHEPLPDRVWNTETEQLEEPQEGEFYGNVTTYYGRTVITPPALGTSQNPREASPERMDFADFNDDGLVDAAVLCQMNTFGSDALPWYTTTGLTTKYASSITWIFESSVEPWTPGADWENDDTVRRSVNLTPRIGLAFPGRVSDIKVADIDNDGEYDELGCTSGPGDLGNDVFFMFPGLGDFEFGPPVAFPLDGPPLHMLAEDFDGDGYVDVAVLQPFSGIVEVFRNDAGELTGSEGVQYEFSE